jgi:hypothetical protein
MVYVTIIYMYVSMKRVEGRSGRLRPNHIIRAADRRLHGVLERHDNQSPRVSSLLLV